MVWMVWMDGIGMAGTRAARLLLLWLLVLDGTGAALAARMGQPGPGRITAWCLPVLGAVRRTRRRDSRALAVCGALQTRTGLGVYVYVDVCVCGCRYSWQTGCRTDAAKMGIPCFTCGCFGGILGILGDFGIIGVIGIDNWIKEIGDGELWVSLGACRENSRRS
ncbi:hypothetical protein EDC01DRAFT_653429 [Geopyxis carbonaria]|nr:hypothetical protein EDC01DRAFT_653429 [Geopyxis carbonaria]